MKKLSLLNTNELNMEITNLFTNETRRLIIVSPFNHISNDLMKILSNSPAAIYYLYQKPKEEKGIKKINYLKKKLQKIKFLEIEYLHAKAYISSKYSIITSLNLIESSQKKNFELGIKFENKHYNEIYKKLIDELRIILKQNNYSVKFLEENYRFIPLDEYITNKYNPRKVYNMKYLYRDILEYNLRAWVEVERDNGDKTYIDISKKISEKYNSFFQEKDYSGGGILKRQATINEEIYKYGINILPTL